MTCIHAIRLRGPWEVSALKIDVEGSFPSIKMPCPCSWKEGGWLRFAGTALHKRRFGRPPQNDANERIWLVIEPCMSSLTVSVNGSRLGQAARGSGFEIDLTEILLPRNELQIEVAGTNESDGLTGEVRLEIRI